MIDLEKAKRLNELIQQETDPARLAQLVQQLLDLWDGKASKVEKLS